MRRMLPRHPSGISSLIVAALLVPKAGIEAAGDELVYDAVFEIELQAGSDLGVGRISLEQDPVLARQLRFFMPGDRFEVLSADGETEADGDRLMWYPIPGTANLRYEVAVTQPRGRGYDGLVTEDWALFRGDDVFPPAWMEFQDGARSRSRLLMKLPDDWNAVTPFPGDKEQGWEIDNPARSFDRPTGWILAGRLGIRRENIAELKVTLASPIGAGTQRVAMLALLRWNLPWLAAEAPQPPERLLIVSGPDPLWRGGLSGPQSLYVHGDLPIIGEDGTSPLLHEICHVLFPVRAAWAEDWIDEGLAEYLSLRVLKETGTISKTRYRDSIEAFRQRGAEISSLGGTVSKGAITARAVALLHDLDRELSTTSDGQMDMLAFTRLMMEQTEPLTLESIRALAENVLGHPPESLAGETAVDDS